MERLDLELGEYLGIKYLNPEDKVTYREGMGLITQDGDVVIVTISRNNIVYYIEISKEPHMVKHIRITDDDNFIGYIEPRVFEYRPKNKVNAKTLLSDVQLAYIGEMVKYHAEIASSQKVTAEDIEGCTVSDLLKLADSFYVEEQEVLGDKGALIRNHNRLVSLTKEMLSEPETVANKESVDALFRLLEISKTENIGPILQMSKDILGNVNSF